MNLRNALGLTISMNCKFLVAWMPWSKNPSRVNYDIGYKQTDPGIAGQQADCMTASGFDGAVLCWQGPLSAFTHQAFMQMFTACVKRQMPILVLLDQWIAKGKPNPTQAVIDALNGPAFQFVLPFLAENWVMEFDLAPVGVNLAAVQSAVPNITLLSKNVGYSWIDTVNTIQALKTNNAKATMKIPGVFAKFNDGGYPLGGLGVGDPAHWNGQRDYNASVWNSAAEYADPKLRKPARIVEARGGLTYLESCAAASLVVGAKYAMYQTWNDRDERTHCEDDCVAATGMKIGV